MSVIIRGIKKLPLCCGECFLMDGETCECSVPGIERTCNPFDGRFDNCPMSFLPTHGKLIDVDKVLDELAYKLGIRSLDYLAPSERAIVSWFRDAPTIIPAEEDEA
jgi:hypothetical protein